MSAPRSAKNSSPESGSGEGKRAVSDGSLVWKVRRRLSESPVHTLVLAKEVLGLAGHDGAAASAVYQLLGLHPRFEVDESGVWSLRQTADHEDDPVLSRPIAIQPFAVVDVETTGGRAGAGSVTEIAICEIVGGTIVDEYQTLVDPGRILPSRITSLTGITNGMLRGAPSFEYVADEILGRIAGRVFAAHNATFDWNHLVAEFLACNRDPPTVPRICTARSARRLLPSLRRFNLDAVARHYGFGIERRHRAGPDALAAARILLRLLDEAAGSGIDDVRTLLWYLRKRRRKRVFDPRQGDLGLR